MTSDHHASDEPVTWRDLVAGSPLPAFSYTLEPEMVEEYRSTVGDPAARYPTIAGRHPTRAFYAALGAWLRAPNMGYRAWYVNPPEVGTTIHVRSLVVGTFQRKDKDFVMVESRANDDRNRLIEVSRLTGLVSAAGGPALAAVAQKAGDA